MGTRCFNSSLCAERSPFTPGVHPFCTFDNRPDRVLTLPGAGCGRCGVGRPICRARFWDRACLVPGSCVSNNDFVLTSMTRSALDTLCRRTRRSAASPLARRGFGSRRFGERGVLLCGLTFKSCMVGSSLGASSFRAPMVCFSGLAFEMRMSPRMAGRHLLERLRVEVLGVTSSAGSESMTSPSSTNVGCLVSTTIHCFSIQSRWSLCHSRLRSTHARSCRTAFALPEPPSFCRASSSSFLKSSRSCSNFSRRCR